MSGTQQFIFGTWLAQFSKPHTLRFGGKWLALPVLDICVYMSAISGAYITVRERPLFCALFTIRTTFRFILTHPPTIQFENI